ncbi:GH17775 [Drosophila grimshawi]|uniref:GH17775 n=1 Tax=Drosophila grimshawi TaxID=7222 RepID=B4JXN7_DROGR|nr:GH17775 [Drosophila grimshawi]
MSQFGLGASNTHWGYGSAASAYSPYLASSGLSSCTTPTSAQFNNPALGFTCSSNDQSNNQDFGGATNRDCVPMLPDSTASDLDQHLSSLVGSTSGQMSHHSLLGASGQTSITSTVNGASAGSGATAGSAAGAGSGGGGNSILVPRYHTNASNEYNVHSSQNGPRSLSDSSQAESPVQEDLLSTNTPNLGSGSGGGATNGGAANGSGSAAVAGSVASSVASAGAGNPGMLGTNQNFPGIVNQAQHASASAYGGGVGVGVAGGHGGGAGATTAGCNGSLYPVLPASLLYSQLYTAANQSAHGFHSHTLPAHASPNSSVHGELQSVMDHISNVGVRQQHNIMAGGGVAHPGDLTLIGNCGASVRNIEDGNTNRQVAALAAHRGHHNPTDNGGSVWRPY